MALNTTYFTTEYIMQSTTFFTSNMEALSVIESKNSDFWYLWVIFFSVFVVIATGIIIRFWCYHFGRLDNEDERKERVTSISADNKVEMMSPNTIQSALGQE